jgi:hypothetical protein
VQVLQLQQCHFDTPLFPEIAGLSPRPKQHGPV